jgi:predicted nucleotidyltransferase
MDQGAVLTVIKQFERALIDKGIVIDRIVLFGSHATGTQRPDSDIDLVVISDTFKDMDYWQRLHLLADAIGDVFQPIEATGLTIVEWNQKEFSVAGYAKDGQVVA